MGWVYILDNESIPGLLKIGCCVTGNPIQRAATLSALTAIPTHFRVLKAWRTRRPKELEGIIHAQLRDYRVQNKEFFRIELEIAVGCINALAGECPVQLTEIRSKGPAFKPSRKDAEIWNKLVEGLVRWAMYNDASASNRALEIAPKHQKEFIIRWMERHTDLCWHNSTSSFRRNKKIKNFDRNKFLEDIMGGRIPRYFDDYEDNI